MTMTAMTKARPVPFMAPGNKTMGPGRARSLGGASRSTLEIHPAEMVFSGDFHTCATRFSDYFVWVVPCIMLPAADVSGPYFQ